MTREEQKALRKQEIIEKSLDLFIANGYAATKISDIARAVNMSTGLLFHYFDSKETLYETLIDYGLLGTKSVMQLEADDCISFFKAAAENILGLHKTNMFAVKMFVLMGQAVHNQSLPEHIKQKLTQIDSIAKSAEIIKKGQQQGAIRRGEPMALSITFWCAIQGVMQMLALHPDLPTPEADWIVDILKNNA